MTCPILSNTFQLIQPDEIIMLFGVVRATTCCPVWLLKQAKDYLKTWMEATVNAALREGHVPATLEQLVVRSFIINKDLLIFLFRFR